MGCGFTRALIDKAPLTKDLMHDLPILEFPELIEDYKALSETRQRIKDKLITERLYSKGSQIVILLSSFDRDSTVRSSQFVSPMSIIGNPDEDKVKLKFYKSLKEYCGSQKASASDFK